MICWGLHGYDIFLPSGKTHFSTCINDFCTSRVKKIQSLKLSRQIPIYQKTYQHVLLDEFFLLLQHSHHQVAASSSELLAYLRVCVYRFVDIRHCHQLMILQHASSVGHSVII